MQDFLKINSNPSVYNKSKNSHGDCGEYNVYINEDGTIGFNGEVYSEDKFDDFLNNFA